MKIAAYVPIKLNNTRLPGKNIKPLTFDGKPLCQLLFETLSKVENIDEKYCFCSNDDINKYITNGIKFLKRDKSLDSNETQCYEIIKSFIDEVNPDIIVLCHATSPFIKKETIEMCVDKVKSGEYDSAFAVCKEQEFLWYNGKPLNFDATCPPRSQDLPEIYKETNGVFVFTKEMFFKTNRRVGLNPFLCKVEFPENIDINYKEDFLLADAYYSDIHKIKE